MVAGSQQQLHQQPPSSSSLPSAEEEAIKRNTDCVYFLASPLTCKKGSECEYRHSEYARVNPRDCWYWLNGSCLNPKCSFRHPPLDGLLGTQVAASAGSSLPSPQTAVTLATHTHNSSKQAVPCIFFQKGLCLKGDRCAFLHGPNPTSNKAPPVLAAAHSTEPPSLKKAYGGLEKCKEQKIQQASISKSVEMPPVAKSASKGDTAPGNGVGNERNIPPPTSMDDELPRYTAENVPPMTNGNTISRSIRLHQTHVSDDLSVQNGRDADEFLRESSPGFDVLVDDELGDDDYYQSEDQYGRTTEHEVGNLNSVREYDIGHSADYSSMADVDQEMFHDSRGYDSYDRGQGQYNWEQRRASSERMSAGPAHVERRGYLKAEGPDRFEEPDLRHRLLKQRRVNGLRSVISHDYTPDNHVEELNYRASRRDSRHLPPHERDSHHLTPQARDSRHLPSHESSLSSRLKGRIKLSGRSSPVDGIDLHPERDMDRGRNWGRLSPSRPQNSLHQGRLRDRIKGRVQEDYNNGERSFRGRIRREAMDDRDTNFAGPKRLAELKVGKNAENNEQQSLGRRRNPMTEDHQQSEGGLSFEGPKPLSVILKRKRGAGAEASRSGILSSVNREEDNQREIKESLISSPKTTTLTEMHNGLPSTSEEANSNKEKSNFSTAKTVETNGKTEASHGQTSQVHNSSELETEDGMIGDEAMEDPELEDVDQKEGDYGYEQVDEGDYNFDEGENADPEEEYLEDDDGDDDFAKKIGVMFS